MMTFIRERNKIHPFWWFVLDTLYREILILIIVVSFYDVIYLIRYGELSLITHLGSVFSDAEWWIYPMLIYSTMIASSIQDIRSAVTQITIDSATSTIYMVYHGAGSLFIKKKTMTFHFSQFKYSVEQDKFMRFRHYILPMYSPINIFFFKENRFRRLSCNIGWTRQQFAEIEQALRNIKPPDQDIYIY